MKSFLIHAVLPIKNNLKFLFAQIQICGFPSPPLTPILGSFSVKCILSKVKVLISLYVLRSGIIVSRE